MAVRQRAVCNVEMPRALMRLTPPDDFLLFEFSQIGIGQKDFLFSRNRLFRLRMT